MKKLNQEIMDTPKVYFSHITKYNIAYEAVDTIELNELPLHRDVMDQFSNSNQVRYMVTDTAQTLITKAS